MQWYEWTQYFRQARFPERLKFRACQIIDELEGDKRGVYGGAIGYLDFTGNMDTCIAIRLVYKKNNRICIRAGAGIVETVFRKMNS
ncbi:MAG: chorismate-binding protein [Anaerovoracaceae bacterium]